MSTLCCRNTTDNGRVSPLLQLAAGACKGHRRHGLALRAIHTAPDSAIHTVESHQPSTRIADRHTDCDVHFLRFGNGARHNSVSFIKGKSHMLTSCTPEKYADIAIPVDEPMVDAAPGPVNTLFRSASHCIRNTSTP